MQDFWKEILDKSKEILSTLQNHEKDEMKLFGEIRWELWKIATITWNLEKWFIELKAEFINLKEEVSENGHDIVELKNAQKTNKILFTVGFMLIIILFILISK